VAPAAPSAGWLERGLRHVSKGQFGTAEVRDHIIQGLDTYQTMKYFRNAGMLAAVRYGLGAPQLSQHNADLYRARVLKRLGTTGGISPSSRNPGYFRVLDDQPDGGERRLGSRSRREALGVEDDDGQ
jgi:hypothetical protein